MGTMWDHYEQKALERAERITRDLEALPLVQQLSALTLRIARLELEAERSRDERSLRG
jgi:hypothetical protein